MGGTALLRMIGSQAGALERIVDARIELVAVLRQLESERIEIGVQMAADAVGADQHQDAHRIARRLLDDGG